MKMANSARLSAIVRRMYDPPRDKKSLLNLEEQEALLQGVDVEGVEEVRTSFTGVMFRFKGDSVAHIGL